MIIKRFYKNNINTDIRFMENIYNDSFIALVSEYATNDTYIGTGNPNAKILIVGREGATDSIPEGEVSLARKWLSKTQNNEAVNFKEYYNNLSEGHTWNKYQKLYNYIFEKEKRERNHFDFKEGFFTTEMNINRAKRTQGVSTEGMEERKKTFFCHKFIQQFPVVVLACGDYIKNNNNVREIDEIFGVTFRNEVIAKQTEKKKYSFWIHRNADESKLVIHTRQLSSDVPDELLIKIADSISEFFQSEK
jgi:hypothetical protein